MFKPTNANAIKLMAEMESGWMESFELDNGSIPARLRDNRKTETPVSRILEILDKEENTAKAINHAKIRKTELCLAYANGETPTLTAEEESRVGRNEEAFYALLVKWGIYEPITEDDLLDQ